MRNFDVMNAKLVENRLFTRDGKRYLYLKYEGTLTNGDAYGVNAEINLDKGIEGYVGYCNDNYPFGLVPKVISESISFNDSTWISYYKEAQAKEMTLEDVENKLGYKVKIVSK